jgi:hypothetical protein
MNVIMAEQKKGVSGPRIQLFMVHGFASLHVPLAQDAMVVKSQDSVLVTDLVYQRVEPGNLT